MESILAHSSPATPHGYACLTLHLVIDYDPTMQQQQPHDRDIAMRNNPERVASLQRAITEADSGAALTFVPLELSDYAVFNEPDVSLAPEVLDCLVFLYNTKGRFPSYNVIDRLPADIYQAVEEEAKRREEEGLDG